jgi:predicted DNA-binding transcriptional regulator AlpA
MKGFKTFITESTDLSSEHEVLSMYRDSNRYQIRQISELTGVSIAGIYRVLEKYGLKPQRRQYDNAHGIVQQYHNSGIPAQKISELTGYSKRQVYNIIAKSRGEHSFNG